MDNPTSVTAVFRTVLFVLDNWLKDWRSLPDPLKMTYKQLTLVFLPTPSRGSRRLLEQNPETSQRLPLSGFCDAICFAATLRDRFQPLLIPTQSSN
ncbi:MAG: hypothetical protein KME25_10165 [Symplocastrum torsivum CPER-KK1]|jgi:hypothetical protein|uniref:Uncharacterized protein n=1 Tax=Symplocastrum torsivum CPER-KK1 TaxID=450513 RepID=A0A951PIX1_9CYAN|nr:hypothetical protein [Symplocastrum torsivum CPER-KK1]